MVVAKKNKTNVQFYFRFGFLYIFTTVLILHVNVQLY